MRTLLVMMALGLAGGWYWYTTERTTHRPPGILVAGEPLQHDLDAPAPLAFEGYTLMRRARYEITARVLRKEIYRIDGGAGLAPVDLGVGWGPMSDTAVVDRLRFEQMGRFFYWRPTSQMPLTQRQIEIHAAQMHMIPSTAALDAQLRKVRPGQVVTVAGYLVDVRGPGGFSWNTSLTRTDVGAGACEIVYVETLEVD